MATNPGGSKLRVNTHDVAHRKPNQEEPGGWWWGPGFFSFFLMVHTALVLIASRRGWETNQIKFIRVANLEGDPRIWFWPTDEKDPERIELKRYRGRLTANLSTVMVNWKMALPTGQRNRYDVFTDDQGESPVGPALYINKDKVLETKWAKKKGSPAQQAAPTAQPPAPSNETPQN